MPLPWLLRRWMGFPEPARSTDPLGPHALAVPPEPVRPAEEAAVRALPDLGDREVLERYASWLERGRDPRGALVRAMLDGEPAAPHVLRDPRLMGALHDREGVEVVWEAGLWRAVRLEIPWSDGLGALLRAVLADPAALVLQHLSVVSDTLPALPDAVADSDPLPLTSVSARATGGQLGTWSAAWPRLQALESLELHGDDIQLGDVVLPRLRALEITGRIPDEALWDLARMHAPALERLTLRGPSSTWDAEALGLLRERRPFASLG